MLNAAPVAHADTYSVHWGQLLTVDAPGVLGNDTDADDDSLTAVLVDGPSHGSFSLASDGSFSFTPTSAYVGEDGFTYKANDGTDDSNVVTVTINLTNTAPSAVADSDSTDEDTLISISAPGVLDNDSDADDDDTISLIGFDATSLKGAAVSVGSNGSWTYDPQGSSVLNALAAGATTMDTFHYTIGDGATTSQGTVTITVTGVNDAPVALDGSESTDEDTSLNGTLDASDADTGDTLTYSIVDDPASGSVTITNTATGAYTFDPGTDFDYLGEGQNVDVTFTFKATDNHSAASATKTVTITVTGVNDGPVALNGNESTDENTSVNGTLDASDLDMGDTLTYSIVDEPTSGSVTITNTGTGAYTFDPGSDFDYLAAGESVDVTFTFKATDSQSAESATKTITVNGVNDVPVAADGSESTNENASVSGTLDASDLDASDTLTYSIVDEPTSGSVAITNTATGAYIFDPGTDFDYLAAGQNTDVTFTFKATDSQDVASDTKTVTVTVNGVNDAPFLAAISNKTVDEGTALTFTASAMDLDTSDTLTFSLEDAPSGATINSSTGEFSWTPDDGPDTVSATVIVSDGTTTASRTFSISVHNVAPTATVSNDGPVFVDHAVSISFSDVQEVSSADTSAGLLYSFDFNNDGDFTDIGDVANGTDSSASHTFTTAGTHIVHVRVTDKDGGHSDYESSVDVQLPRLQFSTSSATVNENVGTVQATVAISPTLTQAAEFYVRVVGGNATQGTDFNPHVGHYQAAIGTSSMNINVAQIIDDAIHEQNETIQLELVPVFGVSLGEATVLTITVQDNDAAPDTSGPTGPEVLTPDAVTKDQESIHGSFYSVALASGALTATHALPAYNGKQNVQLVYSSAAAAPNPIFLVRHNIDDETVPSIVGAILTLDGVTGTEVFFDSSSLAADDTMQIALQGDATGLATGRYAYSIDVTEYFETPVTTTYNGYINIVNNAETPFGAGWSVQGVDRIWEVSAGVILEIAGGVSMWFAVGETTGTYVSPAGDFSTLTKNLDGTFTRVAKNGTQTEFGSAGLQTAVVDLNGNTTTYDYDDGALVSITNPFDSETTFTYDDDRVVEITDPAGRSMALDYEDGNLVSITDPDPDGEGSLDAPTFVLAYDSAGQLTDWTDPNDNTTSFTFNFAGAVASISRPDDTEEHFVAAQMSGLVAPGSGTEEEPALAVLAGQMFASFADGNDNTWNTRLDDLGFGLATQKIDPLNDTTYIVRNTDGLPTEVIDPLQRATSYEYDSSGNATTVTLPDGAQYLYGYDSFGHVTQVTEPDPDGEGARIGSVTQYVFDSAGNLTEVILPDDDTDPENNPTYVYSHDSQGLLTSATDPEGNATAFDYDEQGRLVLTTYADDAETSVTYDDDGNISTTTNERGFTTFYAYDNLGRLTEITLPDDDENSSNNPQQLLGYDAVGNLTSVTNALSDTTSFQFDAMNRLASVTTPDPDGEGPLSASVTLFGYDAVGNQTSVTDPLERVSTTVFDSANRTVQTQRGENYITDYGYDAAGQMTSRSSPAPSAANSSNRLVTNYTYDSRGQTIGISDNTGRQQLFNVNPAGEVAGFT